MSDDTDPQTDEYPEYRAPRRTPHPDDTPLDPYDEQALRHELERHPATRHKRTLLSVAEDIRHAERQVESNLNNVGRSTSGDLRDVAISPEREAVKPPHGQGWAAAKRAQSYQTNLQSLYARWAQLVERHFRAIRQQNTDGEQGDGEQGEADTDDTTPDTDTDAVEADE
jgi:hypothetical protein